MKMWHFVVHIAFKSRFQLWSMQNPPKLIAAALFESKLETIKLILSRKWTRLSYYVQFEFDIIIQASGSCYLPDSGACQHHMFTIWLTYAVWKSLMLKLTAILINSQLLERCLSHGYGLLICDFRVLSSKIISNALDVKLTAS